MFYLVLHQQIYRCLCSMLMMNLASLARTVAACWAPFLVEQNCKNNAVTKAYNNDHDCVVFFKNLTTFVRKKQYNISFSPHHKGWLLVRICLYNVSHLVVERQVKLEFCLVLTAGETQNHLPQLDWSVALIHVQLCGWSTLIRQPVCYLKTCNQVPWFTDANHRFTKNIYYITTT